MGKGATKEGYIAPIVFKERILHQKDKVGIGHWAAGQAHGSPLMLVLIWTA